MASMDVPADRATLATYQDEIDQLNTDKVIED